jgi:hypothetical protein
MGAVYHKLGKKSKRSAFLPLSGKMSKILGMILYNADQKLPIIEPEDSTPCRLKRPFHGLPVLQT